MVSHKNRIRWRVSPRCAQKRKIDPARAKVSHMDFLKVSRLIKTYSAPEGGIAALTAMLWLLSRNRTPSTAADPA